MVFHTLAKLFAIVLDIFISKFVKVKKLRAKRQACFRINHRTCDHILTLRAIIKEPKANKCRVYYCFVDFRKEFDIIPR